ncbi:DoxX family protein [Maricaulis sp.]|uniref:DoxX family protein n=1 Tax=Maricaulis sp. TaxID=1486257 RepID=UPI0026216C17|nr:DoxX family protein [Maricaulis sp.]
MFNPNNNTAYGAALLRVSFGTLILAHGLLKILVFTVPGTVGFFASLGLPAIVAYLVIFAEIAGGLALIAGAYTRIVSLGLIPVLAGATLVHLPNGWLFSAEGGGWEFPPFLVVTAGVQALLGSGAFALKAPRLPLIPRALQA